MKKPKRTAKEQAKSMVKRAAPSSLKVQAARIEKGPLRIMFVNDTDHLEGGSQIYLASTIARLRERGHTIYLVAGKEETHDSIADKTFKQSREGYLRYLDRLRNPFAVDAIQNATATFKPDIIHLNYASDSVSVAGMRAITSPRVVSFHDLVLLEPSQYGTGGHPLYRLYIWFWTNLVRRELNTYDGCIAPSKFVQKVAQRHGVLRCSIIPNGALLEQPSPVPKDKELLFVGKFIESKGVFTLLRAFARVRKHHPTARLSLIGDGPDRAAVLDLIRTLELGDFVTLYPHLGRVALSKRYAAARIVVVPSIIPESFNLVRVEAMSAGRPVVLTPVGGMLEGIANDRDAVVLADTRMETLAKALTLLLDDYARCQRIGAGAVRTASTLSIPEHVRRLEVLYRDLIAASLRRR